MTKLHVKPINDENFVPEEGQLGLMCSNKESFSCPSFGINNPNNLVHEDIALDYFASILAKAFLDHKRNERNNSKK